MTNTITQTNHFKKLILTTEFKYYLTRLLRKASGAERDISDFFADEILPDTKKEITLMLTEYRTITTEEVYTSENEAVMYLSLADGKHSWKDQKISLHLKLVRPWGMSDGIAHANDWRIMAWRSGWKLFERSDT